MIPPRRWLIQEPIHWNALGVYEANRPEDACHQAARAHGLVCHSFQASWLPESRALQARGDALELYAVNMTAHGDLDQLRALDASVLVELAAEADGDFFTAASD